MSCRSTTDRAHRRHRPRSRTAPAAVLPNAVDRAAVVPDADELYISYLRKKIDVGRPSMIHTVRGVGYVLKRERG